MYTRRVTCVARSWITYQWAACLSSAGRSQRINAPRIRRRFPCRDFSCSRTEPAEGISRGPNLARAADCFIYVCYVGGRALLHLIAPEACLSSAYWYVQARDTRSPLYACLSNFAYWTSCRRAATRPPLVALRNSLSWPRAFISKVGPIN